MSVKVMLISWILKVFERWKRISDKESGADNHFIRPIGVSIRISFDIINWVFIGMSLVWLLGLGFCGIVLGNLV